VAHFNVYRSRMGYGFDITSPGVRSKGWRPTRNWAKSVAQREVLAAADLDVDPDTAFTSPGYERPLAHTAKNLKSPKRSRRRRRVHRGQILKAAAAVIVVVVVLAGAIGVWRWRNDSAPPAEAAGSRSVNVSVSKRLQPYLERIVPAFQKAHPDISLNLVFGDSPGFAADAAKGNVADVYIDDPYSFTTWFAPWDAVAPSIHFGYDTLELIVPSFNSKKIKALSDVAGGTNTRLGLCAELLECGAAAGIAFKQASLAPPGDPVRMDTSNTMIDAVGSGKLDAAVVFRTAYAAHASASVIEVPLAGLSEYRIPFDLRVAKPTRGTQAFVDFVENSPDAVTVLQSIGLVKT